MDYVYPIIITPSDGVYLVTIPDLDINAEGNSIENALFVAKDAIGMWGICQQDLGKEIPKCTDYKPVCGENDMVALITIDFDDFRIRQDNRLVRKNVTIPAWMDREATKRKINFPQTLQEALKEKLSV